MITDIAVGVTTAPRELCTLGPTLDSLRDNEWRPHIFAEPGSDLDAVRFGMTTHQNPYRMGAWYNWLHCCRALLALSDAEYILTVQDDTVVAPGTAEFLSLVTWPERCGLLSLYTPSHYLDPSPGLHRVDYATIHGACAMLFQRESLERMLNRPVTLTWRGAKAHADKPGRTSADIANVDTAIGLMLDDVRLTAYWFSPSLSQHIGVTSTLGDKDMGPKRTAKAVVTDFSVFNNLVVH